MGSTLNSKLRCCCEKEEILVNKSDLNVFNTNIGNEESKPGNAENDRLIVEEKDKSIDPQESKEKKKAKRSELISRTVTAAFTTLDNHNKVINKPDSIQQTRSQAVSTHATKDTTTTLTTENRANTKTADGQVCKNFTFSSDSNNLLKSENAYRTLLRKKGTYNNLKLGFIPRQNCRPDEIVMQSEFIVNNYPINNKLTKTKTKNLSNIHKYVLLTRLSIKICKSKDYYISYGTSLTEIMMVHITYLEYTKNPFSKVTLHTINITYGKDNIHFSISSEDGKEIEIWYKLMNFMLN